MEPSILAGSAPYPLEPTIPAGPSSQRTPPTRPYQNVSIEKDPYAFLTHFDTAFLIDDSASMEPYWDEVESLLVSISSICIGHDPNGIDIYFLHHRPRGYIPLISSTADSGYRNIGLVEGIPDFHDNVEGIFRDVKPHGRCKLGDRLDSLLSAIVFNVDQHRRRTRGIFPRPLNLIVITASILHGRSLGLGPAVVNAARRLDKMEAPRHQIGVQLFQVGKNVNARKTMEFVDEQLYKERGVRDIADTMTWEGEPGRLTAEGVLKVVGGAVSRALDKNMF
ncbi:uncharacterized protein BCR38DRAFT_429234 [Pseudomassariella vexata]|uniref:VWFA domain-containing protein n=1 Tax=Pseudomassariella vexata TaxID=1141098 RepID=A0A1Y2E3G1_9PEZI|nr:uncharacterized protein BCR38DRAFT_429234 [Pseudomassariella vexata]ORY66098.1 hypothetical protein BCR38DRAFT_429234 [Pseudomassariella vexata]